MTGANPSLEVRIDRPSAPQPMLKGLKRVKWVAEGDQCAARLECRQRLRNRLIRLIYRRPQMPARFRVSRRGLSSAEFQDDVRALPPRWGFLESPPQILRRFRWGRPTERQGGGVAERVDCPAIADSSCVHEMAGDALGSDILGGEQPGGTQVQLRALS